MTRCTRLRAGARSALGSALVVLACGVGGALATAPGTEQPAPATPDAPAPGTVCPFCRADLANRDFCPRCGRLAHLTSVGREHRFWGDIPYAIEFPPLADQPKIEAQCSPAGLQREVVTFLSGDRYELVPAKSGFAIRGKLGSAVGGKEASYKAEMRDTWDASGRLTRREVWGKRDDPSAPHLYRRLDYEYSTAGRLARIEFDSRFYQGSSDWEKRPASWNRHSVGEIVLVEEGGVLHRIETKLKHLKRSLRGEPELGETTMLKERVDREGESVQSVTPLRD